MLVALNETAHEIRACRSPIFPIYEKENNVREKKKKEAKKGTHIQLRSSWARLIARREYVQEDYEGRKEEKNDHVQDLHARQRGGLGGHGT